MANISTKEGSRITRNLFNDSMSRRAPKWFRRYYKRFKFTKDSVVETRNGHSMHPVFVVEEGDHSMMIRIYFILRIWPLEFAVVD